MSKVILPTPCFRKAVTSIGSPSPESPQFSTLGPKPRNFVQIRKLKSEEIAKIATVLDFSEDYEVFNSWFLYFNAFFTLFL